MIAFQALMLALLMGQTKTTDHMIGSNFPGATIGIAQVAPPRPKPRTAVVSAGIARDQAIFKEWAKAIRESVDASKKLQSRKQTERTARAMRTATLKEDKIRSRYRLSQYQLFLIIKRGVAEEWPTDKPGDLAIVAPIVAQRQASLDSTVFEEELNAWVAAHWPTQAPGFSSIQDFTKQIQVSALDAPRINRELRESAPITICDAKLPDGKTCQRKVVGNPDRRCYEHRTATHDGTRD